MKVFIALIACVVVSEACTCFPFPSLTDAFCYSSFVAHVRVTGRGENTGTRTVRYDVQILEAYRNQTESKQLPSVIVTASSSAACGLDLTTGTEYLIGGSIDENGELNSNQCALIQEWSMVSVTDRAALKAYSSKTC